MQRQRLAVHLVLNKPVSSTCILSCLPLIKSLFAARPWNGLGMMHVWKHCLKSPWHSQLKWSNLWRSQYGFSSFFTTLGHSFSIENFSAYIFICFTVNKVHLKKKEAKSLGLKRLASVKCHPRALTVALTPPKAGIFHSYSPVKKTPGATTCYKAGAVITS